MKTIVYTAIYGDYDKPKAQPVEVKLFTEATHPRKEDHPRMKAKYFKCNPHKVLDCDVSIWIDGSATIKIPGFIQWCINQLGSGDIALFKHPERDCIYKEATYCQNMPKYKDLPIAGQVMEYVRRKYPRDNGLWACGLLIRRHNDRVARFNKLWWEHNKKYTYQDQLSFPVCAREVGLKIKTIDLDLWNNDIIDFNSPHKNDL